MPPPWQTDDQPVKMTIETKTLDGEPQAAEGTVKIYRLKQPAKVVRADLEGTTGDGINGECLRR